MMFLINLSRHVDVAFQRHDFSAVETQVDVVAAIAVTWTDCDRRLTIILQDCLRVVTDAFSRASARERDGDIGCSIKRYDKLESIIVIR